MVLGSPVGGWGFIAFIAFLAVVVLVAFFLVDMIYWEGPTINPIVVNGKPVIEPDGWLSGSKHGPGDFGYYQRLRGWYEFDITTGRYEERERPDPYMHPVMMTRDGKVIVDRFLPPRSQAVR